METVTLTTTGILVVIVTYLGCVAGQEVRCGASGACYRYLTDPVTYTDAEGVCEGLGGNLVTVSSSDSQTELQSVMEQFGVSATWLRGRAEIPMEQFGLKWRWVSDRSLIGPQGCYLDNQTYHDLEEERAIAFGQLTSESCQDSCRSSGYNYFATQDGNRCFCSDTFGLYRHVDADIDATLCLTECVGTASDPSRTEYCGGPLRNSVYKVDGDYAVWDYAQPNNFAGMQECAVVASSSEGRLDDDTCSESHFYLCEIPIPGAASCGTFGGENVGDKCLFFSQNVLMKSWYAARQDCVDRGGDLLKVHTETFRLALATELAVRGGAKWWVGLTSRQWYWAGSQQVVHENWALGEPSRPGHDCMSASNTRGYKWLSADCEESLPVLCLTSDTTPSPTLPTTPTTSTSTTTTTTTTRPTTTTTTPTTTTTRPTTTTTTPTTTTTTTTRPTTTTTRPTTTTTTPTTTTTTTTRPTTTTTTPTTTTTRPTTTTTTPTTTTTTTTRPTTTTTTPTTTTTTRPTTTTTTPTTITTTPTTTTTSLTTTTTTPTTTTTTPSTTTTTPTTTTTTTPTTTTPTPPTPSPMTPVPATVPTTTQAITTPQPTTPQPATPQPTSAQPTTAKPTTTQPSTPQPSTPQPATPQPTSVQPTTAQPTTAQPATAQPTTAAQAGTTVTAGAPINLAAAGASTGDGSSGLGTLEIVLIVVLVLLLIMAILLAVGINRAKKETDNKVGIDYTVEVATGDTEKREADQAHVYYEPTDSGEGRDTLNLQNGNKDDEYYQDYQV